jgi:hypothetical protein
MKRLFVLLCVALTMSMIGIALAASPPTITEIQVWNIGSRTASVSMVYHTPDLDSREWFEVSTHSDLSGAHRENATRISLTRRFAIATFHGLTRNTVYYYRAYVKTHDSEAQSRIDSFRTAGPH